ncbi:retrotransposon protein, putative, ty1-copia subclass [Tanacetum coccineum]
MIAKLRLHLSSPCVDCWSQYNEKKDFSFQLEGKGPIKEKFDHRASKMERSKRVVTQGLKESRRLKHGELKFVMGNRKIMPVIRIGNHNGNVILNVGSSNELDKSKSQHSRLGNINKKCITQLQKDGVLESFDFKSDDVFWSCLLGKMTKSPFTVNPLEPPQKNRVAKREKLTLLDMVRILVELKQHFQ